MQRLKRLLVGLLTLVMLFTSVPVQAFAVQDTNNTEATMNSQNVDFEGTNAVGTLLAEAIAEEQQSTIVSSEDTPYEDGYTLTEIVVQGSVATVTYDAMEEAQLVVVLYSEDGMQLLNTAKTTVTPEQTTATVTFSGDMPQYFMAAAYLLDVYDFSPLCPSYETPMYTQDMQELLDLTVEDCVEEYGEERIYNLDDNDQTNFAVYAEGALLLYEETGVNTVASVDDVNLVYVIENADEQVTALTEGRIVVYEYADGELLLMKVGTITVDGTTVTIQGVDMEIEEVFAVMKVETDADAEDATFDPSGLDESVEYLGTDFPQTYDVEGSFEHKSGFSFYFEAASTDPKADELLWDPSTWDPSPKKGVTGKGELLGSLFFGIEAELDVYISFKRQYVRFEYKPSIILKAELIGSLGYCTGQLGKINIPLAPGINAQLRPSLDFKFIGTLSFEVDMFYTEGFEFSHKGKQWHVQSLSKKPTTEIPFKAEGKFYIAFDLHPSLYMISNAICETEITSIVGIEVSSEKIINDTDITKLHHCKDCVDGVVKFIWELKAKLIFLKNPKLSIETTVSEGKVKILDFFFSFDNLNGGKGNCPNISYLVYINVKDQDKKDVPGADVYVIDASAAGKTKLGTTNSNGLTVCTDEDGQVSNIYLPKGKYIFETNIDGNSVLSPKAVAVNGATTTVLTPNENHQNQQNQLKLLMILPDSTAASSILYYGNCGSSLKWRLYSNNILEIYGEGAMDQYSSASQAPWYPYKDRITNIRIGDSTVAVENLDASKRISVANNAFNGYTKVKKVILENNVASLGENSFAGCTALTEIKLPADIVINQTSYAASFTNCSNITNIHYSVGRTGRMSTRNAADNNYYSLEHYCGSSLTGVYLEEGIVSVTAASFKYCEKLTSIYLPSTLETIGNHAFYNCSALRDMEIPAGVTLIAAVAFHGCSSLPSVTIPSGVTTIYQYTFSGCRGLTELVIPDTVTSLGEMAFSDCRGLTKLTIPADLVFNQGTNASFTTVQNLKTIHYTKGQTGRLPVRTAGRSPESISKASLISVVFEEGVVSIADSVFKDCSVLGSIFFMGNAPSIASGSFSGVTADAFYPSGNSTWTQSVMKNYGGSLTWVPYASDGETYSVVDFDSDVTAEPLETEPGETEPEVTEPEIAEPAETEPVETEPEETEPEETVPVETEPEETEPVLTEPEVTVPEQTAPAETEPTETEPVETESQETVCETTSELVPSSASAEPEETVYQQIEESDRIDVSTPSANAVYGGMNEADFEGSTGAVIQSTTFNGLVAGSEYVMFALVSLEEEDLLAPGNILYIGQAPADANGSLNFRYIQRVPTDSFNVFACGASHRHLKDATITFPQMDYNGELRIAEPTVTYGGETLVEGVDYVVLDGQGAQNAGDYLCTIRGICNYTGLITCKYTVNAGINTVAVAVADLDDQTSVWIDGAEYPVRTDGEIGYVKLPDGNARTMTLYTYDSGSDSSDQKQYPTGMKVWTLDNVNGSYTLNRQEAFDDILQYSGMSIRVTGKKGIRMITSIERDKKENLVSDGLAGYTLKEYGTVVAWASQLNSSNPLVLDKSYAMSNYAYRRGVADPVFAYDGDLMQYTNVLVNFSDEQCTKELALRPYMILENETGNAVTLYGGIVYRSIGYIAYQNRNVFAPQTEAYNYIWDIIHYVYGDVYDEEFHSSLTTVAR